MDYVARFDAAACGSDIDFVLTVKANVTTLCPCSKAIAKYGAHNQRGEVTVSLRFQKARLDRRRRGDDRGLGELGALRAAQAAGREARHRARLRKPGVRGRPGAQRGAAAECASPGDLVQGGGGDFESIHNHNAYACIENG